MQLYDVSLYPPATMREINLKYGAPHSWRERLFGPPVGSPGMDWLSGPADIAEIIEPLGPRIRMNAERRPKGWLLHINGSLRRFYQVGFEPGELQSWTLHDVPGERYQRVEIRTSGQIWQCRLRDSARGEALQAFFQRLSLLSHS